MGIHANIEDIGFEHAHAHDSVENIEEMIAEPGEKKIKSKKAARQQVERRAERKALDRQLDDYYDTLLD